MTAKPIPLIGIAGYKNAGKTTLVERLVSELTERGLHVATIKHAHHSVEIDEPGRDSHRHRMAGAGQVAVVSSTRWAVMTELRGAEEPALDEVIARLGPADIILVEGYKDHDFPKIEVRRQDLTRRKMAGDAPNVVAIASNGPTEPDLPAFNLDDIPAIADFVLGHFGITIAV